MMLPSVKIQVPAGGDTLSPSLREKDSFLKSRLFDWAYYFGWFESVDHCLAGDCVRVHSW